MAAGLPLPAANDIGFATWADDVSNDLNGFVLDETINTGSGVMTTAATFASATTFTVVGDQTATYVPGRRLKIIHAGGTTYCKVQQSVFGATTTVTITNVTSGPTVLTSAITSVAYALDYGGLLGNSPSLADLAMLKLWGL